MGGKSKYKRNFEKYPWIETNSNRPVPIYRKNRGKVLDRKNRKNPVPFELLEILYEDDSTQPAWWTGSEWDARKPIKNKRIKAWRYFDVIDLKHDMER
jgi:hypothetical protein